MNAKRDQQLIAKLLNEYEALGRQHEQTIVRLESSEQRLHQCESENGRLVLEMRRMRVEIDQLHSRVNHKRRHH